MSEEDAFQTLLDNDPTDQTTRLVFADWLDEHDDPRAPGYRALGRGGYVPWSGNAISGSRLWMWWRYGGISRDKDQGDIDENWCRIINYTGWDWPTRRQAEDAAALAFAELPAARQAELLNPKPEKTRKVKR